MECPKVPCKDAAPAANAMTETPRTTERPLTEAAKRAIAEAEARRSAVAAAAAPKEEGGRGGLDPARYGDWEIKGIACDF